MVGYMIESTFQRYAAHFTTTDSQINVTIES